MIIDIWIFFENIELLNGYGYETQDERFIVIKISDRHTIQQQKERERANTIYAKNSEDNI